MAVIELKSLADTIRLGALLGRSLSRYNSPPLFLRGDLGSGKTALTRALVAAMPGAERAQVASPSFTICNRYPVAPPVLHCDLYRCREDTPDELLEALDEGESQIIIEWAEFFPLALLPESYLDINLIMDNNSRLPVFTAHGNSAADLLAEITASWSADNPR